MSINREMNAYPVEDEGWFLEHLPPETDSAHFGALAPLAGLWHKKRRNDGLPAWKDFGFEDFADWHGWLCVFDLVPGSPLSFRVRLWGTHISEMMGIDMTGKIVAPDANSTYEEYGVYTFEEIVFYEKLRDGPCFGYSGGSLKGRYGGYIQYRELHLPLASDGKHVDQILTVTRIIPN